MLTWGKLAPGQEMITLTDVNACPRPIIILISDLGSYQQALNPVIVLNSKSKEISSLEKSLSTVNV